MLECGYFCMKCGTRTNKPFKANGRFFCSEKCADDYYDAYPAEKYPEGENNESV